jgi:hypothetical protein
MPMIVLGLAGIVLLGFLAYLALLAFVVVRTGQTSGLRDVAIAIKAYRGVLGVLTRHDKTP